MDRPTVSISTGGDGAKYFTGEGFWVAAGPDSAAGPRRRRPTLRDTERLTDALRVTRAVLRRVANGSGSAADMEAVRSAIDAADAALGGTR
ncbi:MAG: hypothetical protein KIT43_10540 [Bauldia sp.]|nr:hypothetical protein [Bauldia sp.]